MLQNGDSLVGEVSITVFGVLVEKRGEPEGIVSTKLLIVIFLEENFKYEKQLTKKNRIQ